jgi:hypothetical protein
MESREQRYAFAKRAAQYPHPRQRDSSTLTRSNGVRTELLHIA